VSAKKYRAGAVAHYDDAAYYDQTYKKRTHDVAYYVATALRLGGTVLEYGAGNGRITLPLAREGIRVTAVDHSAPMLASLRAQLKAEAADVRKCVRVRRGDMKRVRLAEKFDLVFCAFNTALHLYSRQDVERFLLRVREHLKPGGFFVVDITPPNAVDLARDADRAQYAGRFRHAGDGRIVKNHEYFDYDPISQVLTVSMLFTPVEAPADAWVTPLTHRQFFPQEWLALLHYNGFHVTSVEGGFAGEPLSAESDTMVVQARVRRGFR
jgi:SAM-dependent methyltransferase